MFEYGTFFQGKFAQRQNLTKTEYFNTPSDYFNCIFDPSNNIKAVKAVNPEMMCVNYEKTSDFLDTLPNVNVVIGAFTTAIARLKLYQFMEPLQQRVMYTGENCVLDT